MKSKNIKIITKAPEITNEELESIKDFDGVLENFEKNGGYTLKVKPTMKILAGLVSLTIVSGVVYFFIINSSKFSEGTTSNQNQSSLLGENRNIEINELNEVTKSSIEPLGDTRQMNDDFVDEQPNKENSAQDEQIDQNGGQPETNNSTIENQKESTYNYIEATPMEGITYLYAYFNKNLTYPERLKKDSIEGTVLVQFTILKDSSVADIKILQSLGEQFDLEAIRVVSNMPKWKPASVNDVPVNSRLSIPLMFSIKK